jgi:hypothetical protein
MNPKMKIPKRISYFDDLLRDVAIVDNGISKRHFSEQGAGGLIF